MAVSLPLGTPTKVVNSVNLATGASTSVDINPVLSLVNEFTLQINPGNHDGLVGKLTGTLDDVEFNVLLCEVGSAVGYTSKAFGPIKNLQLTLTNNGSTSVTVTAWIAARYA